MRAQQLFKISALAPLVMLLVACAPETQQQAAPQLPSVTVAPVVNETITEL